MVDVELHLFSGRPDPRWVLDASASRTLREVVASLSPSDEHREAPGLGYGGFRWTGDLDRGWAWDGWVQTRKGPRADPRREVERLLLDTLPDDAGISRSGVSALAGLD